MTRVSAALWDQLLAQFEEADAEAEAAWDAYEAEPIAANDAGKSAAESRYDQLREVTNRCEDQLLGVEPPTAAAAAIQLKLFARRYHSGDATQTTILERVAAALTRLAGVTAAGEPRP